MEWAFSFAHAVYMNKAVKDIWQNFVDKVDHFIPKSNWKRRLFRQEIANQRQA